MPYGLVRQPNSPHVTEEGVATTSGLGDGRETSGRGDLIVPDELIPLDLQLLSLALHQTP